MRAYFLPLLLAAASTAAAAPAPAYYLRAEYLVNPTVVATPSPRLSWLLPSTPGQRGVTQAAYRILVTAAATGATAWDSGLVNSSQQNQVPYAGAALAPDASYNWTVTWQDNTGATSPPSAPATFGTGPGDDAAWAAAGSQWIGCGPAPSANMLRADFAAAPPSPGATLTRATLYVSGLGWHIAYLNGQRVSRSVLEPTFTHLRLRVLYAAHDVTRLVTAGGANTLAAHLGVGWPGQFEPWAGGVGEPVWNGTGFGGSAADAARQPPPRGALAGLTQQQLEERAARGLGHGSSGYERRLRAWLSLRWSDGSVTSVVTSASALGGASASGGAAGAGWQCGSGALLSDDIYAGTTYDARLETPGWNAPGYNASAWPAAVRIAEPGGAMAPAVAQPVEVAAELAPCAVWESPAAGVYVFDFCQNFAGTVRLSLPGPTQRGTVIRVRHAEAVMHPPYGPKDGSLYYGNLRSAEATDVYTTRGDDAGEVYEPMFTWHG